MGELEQGPRDRLDASGTTLPLGVCGLLGIALGASFFYNQQNALWFSLSGLALGCLLLVAIFAGHWVSVVWRWAPLWLLLGSGIWWLGMAWISPVPYVSWEAALRFCAWPATMLALLALASPRSWRLIAVVLAILITGLSLFAIWQVFIAQGFANATFINRNSFAALLVMSLLVGLSVAYATSDQRFSCYATTGFIAVCAFTLGLTTSRGALLSLALTLPWLMVVAYWLQLRRKRLLVTLLALFVALGLGSITDSRDGKDAQKRITEAVAESHRERSKRTVTWTGALDLLRNAPWHGIGPGMFWLRYPAVKHEHDGSDGFYAHNDYLQITLEAGWPAGLLLLASLAMTVLGGVKFVLDSQYPAHIKVQYAGLILALVAVSGHSLITFNFYLLPLLILLGVVFARLAWLRHAPALPIQQERHDQTSRGQIGFRIAGAMLVVVLFAHLARMAGSVYWFERANSASQVAQKLNYYALARDWWPDVDAYYYTPAWLIVQQAQQQLAQPNVDRAAIASDLKEALALLDRAAAINPYRTQTLYIRAMLYTQFGDPVNPAQAALPKAQALLEQALQMDRFNVDVRVALARLLLANKQHQEGLQVLEGGLGLRIQITDAYINYLKLTALIMKALGDTARAEQVYEQMQAARKRFGLPPDPAAL